MVKRSSLLVGLDDPGHDLSKSLWLSMFVTITASLSGLNSLRLVPFIDPKGIGRCPLAL